MIGHAAVLFGSSLGLVKINTVVDNENEIQQQWM